MKKKEKTPAQGKTAAEELAKKKKALIAELPPMYGMKALTLYSTYARIGDAIAHAYDHAATDNVSASVSSLKTAREAKKSLESMVAKASR